MRERERRERGVFEIRGMRLVCSSEEPTEKEIRGTVHDGLNECDPIGLSL